MAIHKLATGPITMTVSKLSQETGNFGEQVVLDDAAQDVRVYINEMTAMRQLARLDLTTETVIGKTLHIEQIKKDGKTFTNFNLVAPGAAAPTPRATAVVAAAPKVTVADAAGIYAECVAHAMATLGAKCEDAGIPIDASAIQAAAATLFIKVTR